MSINELKLKLVYGRISGDKSQRSSGRCELGVLSPQKSHSPSWQKVHGSCGSLNASVPQAHIVDAWSPGSRTLDGISRIRGWSWWRRSVTGSEF